MFTICFIETMNRVSRYLGHFCAARMQHEGRRVNVRRCSSSRRGDASFTRFHRMTRSRFSLARDDPLFYVRSEEHTSELQSHLNLVCRLLLEKKKKRYSKSRGISETTTTPTSL